MKTARRFTALVLLAINPLFLTAQISPEALSVIERYNRITGGTESKQSITSIIYEGTWDMPEREISGPATIYIQDGEIFGLFLEIPDVGTIKNCFAHGKAWVENPFMGTQGLKGTEFEQMGKSSVIFPEIDVDRIYAFAQIQEHRDANLTKLLLKDKKGEEETWWFDTQTGLLSEIQSVMDAGVQGSFIISLKYSNYQPFGDLLLAHTFTWHTPAYEVEIRVTHIQTNAEIPVHLFQPPAEASEADLY